jgi:hypothetical protein
MTDTRPADAVKLWPDQPLHEGPATRTDDLFIVVRLRADVAQWLALKTPDDPILSIAVERVLRQAMEAERKP